VEVEEHPWGLLVRKPCFPGSLLAVAFVAAGTLFTLARARGVFAEIGLMLLISAIAAGICLLFLECLWSIAQVDREGRVVRFFVFGRLWKSVSFDAIAAVVARWDGEGFLIPMLELKNGKVVRFYLTQSPTSRQSAKQIEDAVATMQRALQA
jgi:hypothetical protein